MQEVSDAYVAVMAEQTSDISGFVAVVNMKRSSPSRGISFANGTEAALRTKYLAVLAHWKAVEFFTAVVFRPLWIVITPLFLFVGDVFKVFFSPLAVQGVGTDFAVHGQAVYSRLVWVEFVARLRLLAAGASLGHGNVKAFSRHRSAYKSLLRCCQAS